MAFSSCATPGHGAVVRLGAASIDRTTVDHWSAVLAGGRASASAGGPDTRERRQAVGYLIAAHWLIGEARERGVKLSPGEIRRQVGADERAAFPGGAAERNAFFDATGETAADVELEATATLAGAKLRALALASAPPVTQSKVAQYYTRHVSEFTVPELREVWITNRKSAAAGRVVVAELESGRRASAHLEREVFVWPSSAGQHNPYKSLERAIHAARLHALVGPVKQRNDYFVFELRRIADPVRRPLSRVAGKIRTRLTRESLRRALAAFIVAWSAKWTAKTDCHPRYVVQKCAQYSGPRSPEGGLGLQ
jgi:hypothetical protein